MQARQQAERIVLDAFGLKLAHCLVHEEGERAAHGVGPLAAGLDHRRAAVVARIAGEENLRCGRPAGAGGEVPLSPRPPGIEGGLARTASRWTAACPLENDRETCDNSSASCGPLVGENVLRGGTRSFQSLPAAEVRLPANPFVAVARPGATGQIDDRFFAPLGGLEAVIAKQRQLLFADVEEDDPLAPAARC